MYSVFIEESYMGKYMYLLPDTPLYLSLHCIAHTVGRRYSTYVVLYIYIYIYVVITSI